MFVALSHGYPASSGDGGWSMGGEVALHRTLLAARRPVTVLTRTPVPYEVDGVRVERINVEDVLNVNMNPTPIMDQLRALNATAVLAQNELSYAATRAARFLRIPSIVSVHTPPRYGKGVRRAVETATYRIFNTEASKREWRRPGIVIHPPVPDLPRKTALTGDAYTLLSSLQNKGVTVVLELAARMPDQRFIIVRSPAESTHGIPDLEERVAVLPNVELHPRVPPGQVASTYLTQTRILLAPSRYETYGMVAVEAAAYGIPSVHVDTPHVREGIGAAAELVPPLNTDAVAAAITRIEGDYDHRSNAARARAEELQERQTVELAMFGDWLTRITPRLRERASSLV